MKKRLGCCLTVLALSPLMSLAVNADAPPACPAPASLKNIEIQIASKQSVGWLAGSAIVNDDVYKALVIMMYESSITNENESLALGAKIAQAATTVIQHKYYWDEKHTGSYFWGCEYDVPTDSLNSGDEMGVFSKDYNAKGALASDHTLAQKMALVRGLKK